MPAAMPPHSDDDEYPTRNQGCFGSSCVQPTKYSKVGPGKGDYGVHEEFRYVGEGSGDYDKHQATAPPQFPWRTICICILALLFLLALLTGLIIALVSLFGGGPEGGEDSGKQPDVYDCETGFDNWANAWGVQQKDYCCRHKSKGCPTTLHPGQMDCEQGRANWEKGWTEAKKDWCCGYRRTGCQHIMYDCSTGFEDFEHEWTETQKEWCCKDQGKACKPPTEAPHETTTSLSPKENPHNYKCDPADQGWRHEWSEGKKAFCCTHAGLGCNQPEGTTKNSCSVMCMYKGFSANCSARVLWSSANEAKDTADSCKVAHKSVLQQCDVCSKCMLADTGCNDTNPDDYDCKLGLEDYDKYWSVAKQAWCCLNEKKGCSAPAQTSSNPRPVYDCTVGRNTWSAVRKAWCCQNEGKGCANPNSGGPHPYDCAEGFGNWVTGWSVGKKDWCCQQKGVGCTTTPRPR
mmetsp:Transcript_78346/g.201734  ORF Transcript_78346/g.201734 Transcript_78346/m.201734 type:complete len:460 (-) Transcript_78346:265-1644(-)